MLLDGLFSFFSFFCDLGRHSIKNIINIRVVINARKDFSWEFWAVSVLTLDMPLIQNKLPLFLFMHMKKRAPCVTFDLHSSEIRPIYWARRSQVCVSGFSLSPNFKAMISLDCLARVGHKESLQVKNDDSKCIKNIIHSAFFVLIQQYIFCFSCDYEDCLCK